MAGRVRFTAPQSASAGLSSESSCALQDQWAWSGSRLRQEPRSLIGFECADLHFTRRKALKLSIQSFIRIAESFLETAEMLGGHPPVDREIAPRIILVPQQF